MEYIGTPKSNPLKFLYGFRPKVFPFLKDRATLFSSVYAQSSTHVCILQWWAKLKSNLSAKSQILRQKHRNFYATISQIKSEITLRNHKLFSIKSPIKSQIQSNLTFRNSRSSALWKHLAPIFCEKNNGKMTQNTDSWCRCGCQRRT